MNMAKSEFSESVVDKKLFALEIEFLIYLNLKKQQLLKEYPASAGYEGSEVSKNKEFENKIRDIVNPEWRITKDHCGLLSYSNVEDTLHNLQNFIRKIHNFETRNRENSDYFFEISDSTLNMELEIVTRSWIKDTYYEVIDEGAIFQILSNTFKLECRRILQELKSSDTDEFEHCFDYIRDRFFIITNPPNSTKMAEINNKLVGQLYNINGQNVYASLRDNIFQHFSNMDKCSNENKLLDIDFNRILQQTVLESKLISITVDFFKELPFAIKFREESLTCLEILSERYQNVCKSEEYGKVFSLKLFQSIKKKDEKVLLVPLSKLNSENKKSIEFYKKKIVIFADEENIPIYLDQLTCFIDSFSLDELTVETISTFLEQQIKIQNVRVKIKEIKSIISEELLSKIFIKLINNEKVEFGRELPQHIVPLTYIDRKFYSCKSETKFEEKYLFDEHPLCVVKGNPGLGKSSTLQKIVNDFKKKNPEFWVEFFELGKLFQLFFLNTGPAAVELSNDECKTFLIENLLSFGKDKMLDRLLFNDSLAFEKPKILLVFDALDEIMPNYENSILNFIQKLSLLKINIVVSTRKHQKDISKKLITFEEITILEYEKEQTEQFLEEYSNISFESNSGIELKSYFLTFFSELFFQKNMEHLLKNPLLLKLLIDIMIKDFSNSHKNLDDLRMTYMNVTNFYIYERTFNLNFEEFHEQKEIDPKNTVVTDKKEEIERIRKLILSIAVMQLKIDLWFPEIIDNDPNFSELLGKGLVSRDDFGRFYLVHRTFAEYLASQYLANEIEKGNKIAMEYINREFKNATYGNFPVIHSVFELLINRIKTNETLFKKTKGIGDCEKFFVFSQYFAFFCYEYFESDVSKVFELLKSVFPLHDEDLLNLQKVSEDFIEFYLINREEIGQTDYYWSNLDLLLQFYTDIRNKDFRLKVLEYFRRTWIQFSVTIVKINWKRYTNAIYAALVANGVQINGIIQETLKCIQEKAGDSIPRILLSSNDMKIYTCSDLKRDLEELWMSSKAVIEFAFFVSNFKLQGHLNETFLSTFWSLALEKRKVHDMLTAIEYEMYHDEDNGDLKYISKYLNEHLFCSQCKNNFCLRFFFKKSLTVLQEFKYEFLTEDGNSIFYYFWINKNKELFEFFLEGLSKHTVWQLTRSPYFGGKSLINFYKTDFEFPEMIEPYFKYFSKKYNADEFVSESRKYLSKFNENWSVKSIINDLWICCTLNIKSEDIANFDETLESFVDQMCQNVVDFEIRNKSSIYFLHNVAQSSNYFLPVIYSKRVFQSIFNFLKSKNSSKGYSDLLFEKIYEKDENGNTPLHFAALTYTENFLYAIIPFISKNFDIDAILHFFKITNNENQHFFHCIRSHLYIKSILKNCNCEQETNPQNYKEFKKKISQLLRQQDVNGKTPLHVVRGYIFLDVIDVEDAEFLLTVPDNKQNNVFHYMASAEHLRYFLDTYRSFCNLCSTDVLKKALRAKNCDNETPIEIHKRLKVSRVLHWLIEIKFRGEEI